MIWFTNKKLFLFSPPKSVKSFYDINVNNEDDSVGNPSSFKTPQMPCIYFMKNSTAPSIEYHIEESCSTQKLSQ